MHPCESARLFVAFRVSCGRFRTGVLGLACVIVARQAEVSRKGAEAPSSPGNESFASAGVVL